MKHGTMINIFRIKQNLSGNRIAFVDYWRGLTMILVLLHHSGVPHGNWILAFHMPLFFIISGYVESIHKKSVPLGQFIRNRFIRLIVPYLLFESVHFVIWTIMQIATGQNVEIEKAVISIMTCINTESYPGFFGRFWFWPCLFVADILFYFVKKICNDSQQRLWISFLCMLGLSWCTCRLIPYRLPFAMDTACMAAAFLCAGYALKKQIDWLVFEKKIAAQAIVLVGMLMMMRISVKYGNGYFLMFENAYGPFFWSVSAALSGSAAFTIIAKWLYGISESVGIGKHFVLWYGYHSLTVFPVHVFIKTWVMGYMYNRILLSNVGIVMCMSEQLRSWYVLFTLMLFLSIPFTNVSTLFFPILIGKIPEKRKAT